MSGPVTMQRLAVAATALLMSLWGCGEEGGTASTTTEESTSRAQELVTKLDCDQQTSANDTFKHSRWPFTESVDCCIDGRPSPRVHHLRPAHRTKTALHSAHQSGAT